MVYIEPKNPVTPEQMESGVLYFLTRAILVILVPMLLRGNAPGTV
jgi:hypothetical protein